MLNFYINRIMILKKRFAISLESNSPQYYPVASAIIKFVALALNRQFFIEISAHRQSHNLLTKYVNGINKFMIRKQEIQYKQMLSNILIFNIKARKAIQSQYNIGIQIRINLNPFQITENLDKQVQQVQNKCNVFTVLNLLDPFQSVSNVYLSVVILAEILPNSLYVLIKDKINYNYQIKRKIDKYIGQYKKELIKNSTRLKFREKKEQLKNENESLYLRCPFQHTSFIFYHDQAYCNQCSKKSFCKPSCNVCSFKLCRECKSYKHGQICRSSNLQFKNAADQQMHCYYCQDKSKNGIYCSSCKFFICDTCRNTKYWK